MDRDRLVRAVLSGRRGQPRKVVIRPVRLRAGHRYQVTSHHEKRSYTRNVRPADFRTELDALLAAGWRTLHVATMTSTLTVRVSKRGKVFVHEEAADRVPDHSHDEARSRVLTPDAPFLRVLGVASSDGRIKASKQAKYRQIDKFLRLLSEAAPLSTLPRPLHVVDLGCGSADLTFAAYHHLAHTLGIPVDVEGVDVDGDAVARNNARAAQLGWTSLRFIADRILDHEVDRAPTVVLALHACDTATDEALVRAIAWRSEVILAAPCCHHHLQAQLSERPSSSSEVLLLRHGILLQRFGDVLTDGLRASILRMHGYRTDVFQFVATEHTAKNVMIRAIRTGASAPSSEIDAYRELCDEWHVTPKLEQLLSSTTQERSRA